MEFFQTNGGRKFYEGDVPRIIRGIEGLTKALDKNNELKEKELELKEKELKLKERELIILSMNK